jgi:hypothetical protein
MGRLDVIRARPQAAATLKQLRDAALADEHGVELNRILTTL